jgi:rRNA-processing protein FCF1
MVDLKDLGKNYKIFIDTCSLMHPDAKSFFNDFSSNLIKNQLIIPFAVLRELEGLSKSDKNKTKESALRGYKIFKNLRNNGDVIIRGEKGDGYTDNLFQVVFTKYRAKYNLCLITQDKNLAKDVLDLNNSRSSEFNKVGDRMFKNIKAIKIDKGGWVSDDFSKKATRKIQKTKSKPFKLISNTIKPKKATALNISIIPKQKGIVKDESGKSIILQAEINSGGEGIIYSTVNEGEVCKIYKKGKITDLTFKKLKLMTENRISYPRIAWPKSILYNKNNEPVGYLMNNFTGTTELQKKMFVPVPLIKEKYPNWDKNTLIGISIDILNKINVLHKSNVIIGDLNPLNILIGEDLKTYFVDTDSYQIEEIPCPVGTINFTAPEIQGKENFRNFLRTIEQENFAIATLIFMILFVGKLPYSHQGGTTPGKNIKKMDFSYPLGELSNKKAPPGFWPKIWSNLPYYLKETFYNLFKKNERINVSEWLSMLKRYNHDLKKGYLIPDLFPDDYKQVDDETIKNFNKGENNNG